MISRYITVVLALLGIGSAVMLTLQMRKAPASSQFFEEPLVNPFEGAISASGIIEAVHENIAVGMEAVGVIESVFKETGQFVEKGEPLLALDSSEVKAELKIKQAKVLIAKAKLLRLQDQYERFKSIQDPRAISVVELKTKENDVHVAESELEEAIADLAWIQEKLEKMTLRAPQSGFILQKRAKVGEFFSPMVGQAPFVIGDLSELQIRADVDEQNASWIVPGTKAFAYPKNRPDLALPLTFVKIEPYIVPKKSLTGMSDERVDTRVLQVIYRVKPPKDFTLYVGQQVDLFIEREVKS